MSTIFHPTIRIFDAGRIDATSGEFQFCLDGVTPTVARLMEVLEIKFPKKRQVALAQLHRMKLFDCWR
jgi:hypothetical protein